MKKGIDLANEDAKGFFEANGEHIEMSDSNNNIVKLNHKNPVNSRNFLTNGNHRQAVDNGSKEAEMSFNGNFQNEENFLGDDLSMLPVIDEKSLLSCFKSKFEARKYYVRFEFINYSIK